MATTERRRSFSFGFRPLFGRSESKSDVKEAKEAKEAKAQAKAAAKAEAKYEGFPRLRRKLQKVSRQNDSDGSALAHHHNVPAPSRSSQPPVQHIFDGSFLSIKYDEGASRPRTAHSGGHNAARPVSMVANYDVLRARDDSAQAMKERLAQAENHGRAMALVEAQERAKAQTWSASTKNTKGIASSPSINRGNPVQAPRTTFRGDRSAQPPPLSMPQSPPVVAKTVPRHYPQYHRPYSSSSENQNQNQNENHQVASPTHEHQPWHNMYSCRGGSSHMSPAHHSMTASVVSASTASLSPSTTASYSPSYAPSATTPPRSSSSSISPPSSFVSNFPNSPAKSSDVVPELFYLSRDDSHNHSRYGGAPPTPDSPATTASNDSSISSSTSQKRRKPKTPVHQIGQLENGAAAADNSTKQQLSPESSDALGVQTPPESPLFPPTVNTTSAELSLIQSKSSIECIAEEYRALLASRNSVFTDARSAFEPESDAEEDTVPQQYESAKNRALAQRRFMLANARPPPPCKADSISTSSPLPSPMFPARTSRASAAAAAGGNGINVGVAVSRYDEDNTSCYKPEALDLRRHSHHAPPSRKPVPSHAHSTSLPTNLAPVPAPAPVPSLEPGNVSLQICLDLLQRELSSAIVDRHKTPGGRTTPTAPALQILVMIEAYERLRDRMVADSLRNKSRETSQVEAMFGTWLRALYGIHESLTSAHRPEDDSSSDSEYEETGEFA